MTIDNGKKLTKGQILELNKMFNNSNLKYVAKYFNAVPVFSWGGKKMQSWFPDVAESVVTYLSNTQNTGGWSVDEEKVHKIYELMNEATKYISGAI